MRARPCEDLSRAGGLAIRQAASVTYDLLLKLSQLFVKTFGECYVGTVGDPSTRSEFPIMTLRRFEQLLSVISDSVLEDDFHVLDV